MPKSQSGNVITEILLKVALNTITLTHNLERKKLHQA